MSTIYTAVAEVYVQGQDVEITIPEDGDDRSAISVNEALTKLADYIKALVNNDTVLEFLAATTFNEVTFNDAVDFDDDVTINASLIVNGPGTLSTDIGIDAAIGGQLDVTEDIIGSEDLFISGAGSFGGGIVMEATTGMTLASPWVDAGGGAVASGYYKDPFSIVHLQGTVSTVAGTGTSMTITTLPVGYRPSGFIAFVATGLADVAGTLAIASTGVVTLSVPGGIPASTAFSFDGVTFRV